MNHKVELENLKKNLPQLDLDGAYYAGSDDINEMIIWSSNIQDPTHELFNPFLLTQ